MLFSFVHVSIVQLFSFLYKTTRNKVIVLYVVKKNKMSAKLMTCLTTCSTYSVWRFYFLKRNKLGWLGVGWRRIIKEKLSSITISFHRYFLGRNVPQLTHNKSVTTWRTKSLQFWNSSQVLVLLSEFSDSFLSWLRLSSEVPDIHLEKLVCSIDLKDCTILVTKKSEVRIP